MKLAKVDGAPGLRKDVDTGMVVRINRTDADAARARKRARQDKKQQDEILRSEVEDLKSEVSDMKDMLTKILEKL